jgi:hypothetical protein
VVGAVEAEEREAGGGDLAIDGGAAGAVAAVAVEVAAFPGAVGGLVVGEPCEGAADGGLGLIIAAAFLEDLLAEFRCALGVGIVGEGRSLGRNVERRDGGGGEGDVGQRERGRVGEIVAGVEFEVEDGGVGGGGVGKFGACREWCGG